MTTRWEEGEKEATWARRRRKGIKDMGWSLEAENVEPKAEEEEDKRRKRDAKQNKTTNYEMKWGKWGKSKSRCRCC